MANPEWVDYVGNLGTGLGALVATVTAGYLAIQHRRTKRWKANDLAAAWLQKLDSDQCLAMACQSLDWGVGPLIIPEQYKALFRDLDGTAVQQPHPEIMEHDPQVMYEALQPRLTSKTLSSAEGLLYRFCFDKLFAYFDQVYCLLEDGQLAERDLSSLSYWLARLRCYQYPPAGVDGREVFVPAVQRWGYANVEKLWLRLKVEQLPLEFQRK